MSAKSMVGTVFQTTGILIGGNVLNVLVSSLSELIELEVQPIVVSWTKHDVVPMAEYRPSRLWHDSIIQNAPFSSF